MLKINNNEYNVLMSSIKYVEAIYNSQKVYSALVLLDIQLNGNKDYIFI